MPTKPSLLFRWAYGGGASVSQPPEPSRSSGFPSTIPLLAAWLNWCFNTVGEWIAYFEGRVEQYDTLEELVAAVTVGDSAELVEYDFGSLPGTSLATIAAGAAVVDIACDGRYVYVATATTLKRYNRTGGTLVTTYTKTNAGNIVRVVTNGDAVAIAYSTYVECFNAAGTSRWVIDHGATVHDVAIDSARVYMAGARDGSNRGVRGLALATGVTNWSYVHDTIGTAALFSIATDGRVVYVAGAATGNASLANLRALNASDGRDATGETGPADTAGLSWNAVSATAVSTTGVLAVDDTRLYIGYQSASTIEARSKLTGAVLSTVTPPSSIAARRLSVDQDMLIVGGGVTGDAALALSKADLSTMWRFVSVGGAYVATDGAALFAATSSTVHRVARGNRSSRWVRVDPADDGLPYRWLAIPQR